ncbi:hypothetical protein F1D05_08305 [Kribbella qitaiheensis]|uniref:Uncharacterized protein n=1 Tax=Kribbella qitaiheensis TaxID=1544730 RepID=A0A7G6WV79_9ACTN|nr:hypothetical protein [Kribbella qitaiheensis]QNE17894.1 hypothetical protein F1D05_08305 [Kribbella qitaiheensis]
MPLTAVLRYDGFFVVGVVLPGILVLRVVWRSTGNWAEDAGLGAPVGIVFQLAGWGIFTALGFEHWLVVWPTFLLAAFVVSPRLRRYWRIARPAPLPLSWSWAVAIAIALLTLAAVAGPLSYHLLPTQGTSLYQDLLYHLSMVHELMRSVPPQLPQVSGELLDYHWFANADMAAAADVTRLAPELILFRLWPIPLIFVVVLLTAVLARQVSRQWMTALFAVIILAVPSTGVLLGLRGPLLDGTVFWYLSPSHNFALIMLTAAAVFLVEALYRCGQPGVWGLAVAMAVVGAGSKPTVIPILLGGVGMSGLYLFVRKRAVPGRSMLTCLLLVLAGMIAMSTVTGSTSGSGLRPLAVLRVQPQYKALTGDTSLAATGGRLLAPIASGQVTAIVLLLALVLVGQLGLLVGFGLVASRRTATDPAAWFLIGGLTAGWLAFGLVDHPSASEYYFLRGLVTFAAVATAWMITVAVHGRSPRTVAVLGLTGLGLGSLIVRGQKMVEDPTPGTGWAAIGAHSRGIAVALGVFVLGWILWRRMLAARPGLAGMGLLIPVLMVVGVWLTTAVGNAWTYQHSNAPHHYTSKNLRYSLEEQAAALWLGANSAPDDVVATNTACWPNRRDCVSLGYLVSGLAGRRTMLEGWAYTQQAMAGQGNHGLAYMRQPAPWQDRWQLTVQFFSAPTPESARTLHDEYGVRWIFADRAANLKLSTRLGEITQLRYRNATVEVFELTGDPAAEPRAKAKTGNG